VLASGRHRGVSGGTWTFRSIERRIPPYECGEQKMINVFEKADEPPYWGAYITLPRQFCTQTSSGRAARSEIGSRRSAHACTSKPSSSTWPSSTVRVAVRVDLLSRVKNSYDLVDNEFPLLAKLQAHYLACR